MSTTAVEIRVVTAPGTNASQIGEVYAAYEGVRWSRSVNRCDSDGCGRVFLTCDSEDTAEFVRGELDQDDRVTAYD